MSACQTRRTSTPRTPLGPTRQPEPHLHQDTLPTLSLSLPFTPQLSLSHPLPLYSKSWRSFTLSSTIEAPTSPELRRRTLENDTADLHHLYFLFLLGARSFPMLHLHLLLSLPQASSKKDDLELHQVLNTILKPLPVFHSSPVSLSHPRYTPIALDLKVMEFSRAISPWMT